MNKLFTLLDNKLSLLNKDEMIIMKKVIIKFCYEKFNKYE